MNWASRRRGKSSDTGDAFVNSGANLTCFKAYDVRGKLGEELNEDIAYRIGRATAQSQKAKTVAVGFDARATSPDLARAMAKGICDAGADVFRHRSRWDGGGLCLLYQSLMPALALRSRPPTTPLTTTA